jgi:3-methyl-2-oxobutanoate hydroxymethyltransferase
MLGINKEFSPRFLRRYLNLYESIFNAVTAYTADVKKSDFPSASESY